MSLAYVPPGVSIQELTDSSLTPLLALPGSLMLVGPAQGYITRTDTVILSGSTATVLPGLPVDPNGVLQASLSAVTLVMDAVNPANAPSGYSSSTDYTLNLANGTIARTGPGGAITTTGTVSANATTISLAAGSPVPAAGTVIRLTNTGASPVTELVTVVSTSGTSPIIVTLAAGTVNSYASGYTATWSTGLIPDSSPIYVTYQYVPSDYYYPIRLNSMADIQNRFGTAWTTDNTSPSTPLSFAANLAFQNGVTNLVLQPLYKVNNQGARVAVSASDIATPATWSTVFNNALDLEDVNLVVPVVGQTSTGVTDSIMLQIAQTAQDYVYAMSTISEIPVIAFIGEDSSASSTVAQEATLQVHASTIKARYGGVVTQQMVFINISQLAAANSKGTVLVGAQYAAAALAGAAAARNPGVTLTRQAISGFVSVTDNRTKFQKNADAQAGMLVLENKNGVVQVRHSITMDSTSSATRELNVVRSKHYTVASVRLTLDNQVIGKVVADADAPTIVNNVVIGTLEDLKQAGIIVDYANVASRITSLDPTAMEVRFSYRPPFYVNYVTVVFSLDLTAQTILLTSSGTTQG